MLLGDMEVVTGSRDMGAGWASGHRRVSRPFVNAVVRDPRQARFSRHENAV